MTTTTHLLDGVPIDLTRPQLDVLGWRWEWTGERTSAGVPLMQSEDDPHPAAPLPLDELYATRGPLIPASRPTTAALARTVLRAQADGTDHVRPPLPTRPVLQSPAATAAPNPEPKPADPLAYGPTGCTCGCGMSAHSNLVPCQPDETPAALPVPSPSALARILGRLRGAR